MQNFLGNCELLIPLLTEQYSPFKLKNIPALYYIDFPVF